MNVVHVISDGSNEYNSSYWRGVVPSRALERAGHKVYLPHVRQWFEQSPEVKAACALADLIIVQRVLVAEALDHARFWRDRHKPLVCDFDDSYALLRGEDGNQASLFWFEGKVEIKYPGGDKFTQLLAEHPIQQFYRGGSFVTGYTMPSRILVEDYRQYARCWYVPNYIYSPLYLQQKRKSLPHSRNELVIGWGGSMSHLNSFRHSGVSEALRRVFAKRRNVKFMLCGDERIAPLLPIPQDRLIFQHYVQWFDWPRILSRFDITLAPLAGRYDDSRSSIKPLEAGIMGIPIVYSGSPAYTEWMARGFGLHTADSSASPESLEERIGQWESCLLDMIDNYAGHKRAIDGQFDYAMSWDVDRNIHNLEKTYEEIIAHG